MMASGSRTAAWLEALPTVTVTQPAHLETHDATLATEILPAPPTLAPLTATGTGAGTKRDGKRAHGGPSVISYLPAHDPSSTFSSMYAQTFSEPPPPPPPLGPTATSMPAATAEPEPARRPKRARLLPAGHHRVDRSVKTAHKPLTITIRRGSPTRAPPIDGNNTDAVSGDELDGGLSRERSLSSPSPAADEPGVGPPSNPAPAQPPSARDDIVLHNNDHCSSCRSVGALVYCDGCPRAFHLWCLDPPIEPADLSGDVKWLCPACSPPPQLRAPPPKRRSKLDSHPIFGALLSTMREQLPTEFQLPQEIRSYFRDVATGPRGTYLGGGKAPRPSRNGVIEDREPFRLRDRDNEPVLCFRCNKTAYSGPTASRPNSSSSSYSSMRTIDAHGAPFNKRQRLSEPNSCDDDASVRRWRSIVSCDYCDLHWHLDCLDPPLTVMPPRGHRWMCPNHVDQALPNRRIPKHVHKVVDVNETGVLNNGFIDIIPSDDPPRGPSVDEVFIAGTRYRVPERIVLLDFWDRCQRVEPIPPSRSELDAIEVLTQLRLTGERAKAATSGMTSQADETSSLSPLPSSATSVREETAEPLRFPVRSRRGHSRGVSTGVDSARSPGSTLSTLTPTPPPSPPKIMLKIRLPPRPPNSAASNSNGRPPQSLNTGQAPSPSPVASTSHVSPGKIILPSALTLAKMQQQNGSKASPRRPKRTRHQSSPSNLDSSSTPGDQETAADLSSS